MSLTVSKVPRQSKVKQRGGWGARQNIISSLQVRLLWEAHTMFGVNGWRFQQFYLQKGGYFNKEIVGYKNLDLLKRKVRGGSFIIRKEECLDLPGKIFQTVPVELCEQSKKL